MSARSCVGAGLAGLALAVGCATAPPAGPPVPPGAKVFRHIVTEQWFTVPTRCGQGPYELELTTAGGRWQEEIELQVESRKHRVRLSGVILVDDEEVARRTETIGLKSGEEVDNEFCVATPADVAQAMQRPSGAAGAGNVAPSAPAATGRGLPAGPVAATLTPAARPENGGWPLVDWRIGTYGVPDVARKGGQRVRIRFWSSVPNDFEGTLIGFRQMLDRPDSDEAYEAWVVAQTRWDREEAARRAAARTPADEAADRKRHEEEVARAARWAREIKDHCAAQPDDWQCMTPEQRAAKQLAMSGSPPPPPRAEQQPPRPSQNAEWRSGYWSRAGNDWIWIAGMWRVPEEDVRAERTTHAPVAPPAPPSEATPVAPAPTTVWTPGFWQWSGSGWVWVAGSWQLPPAPGHTWQPPRWTHRAGVFVFVPGGWVNVGRR